MEFTAPDDAELNRWVDAIVATGYLEGRLDDYQPVCVPEAVDASAQFSKPSLHPAPTLFPLQSTSDTGTTTGSSATHFPGYGMPAGASYSHEGVQPHPTASPPQPLPPVTHDTAVALPLPRPPAAAPAPLALAPAYVRCGAVACSALSVETHQLPVSLTVTVTVRLRSRTPTRRHHCCSHRLHHMYPLCLRPRPCLRQALSPPQAMLAVNVAVCCGPQPSFAHHVAKLGDVTSSVCGLMCNLRSRAGCRLATRNGQIAVERKFKRCARDVYGGIFGGFGPPGAAGIGKRAWYQG